MSKRVTPILIIGEPGSGKRKIVREIHQISPFSCYPLIMIDCASVTQQQLSKELDTDNQKTLYYHNICELDSSLQKVVASSLSNKKMNEWLDRYQVIKEEITQKIKSSREKDYTNPFRKMVYQNQAEMDAIVGDLKDNSFIEQQNIEQQKLNQFIIEFKQALKAK